MGTTMTGTPTRDTVLVVDDDPAIVALVRDVLRDDGLRVVAVTDAEAALAALSAIRFALVLCDTLGASSDDVESHAGAIRARAGDTPVVLFSAHNPQSFDHFRARGFAGLIPKPFDIDDLTTVVRRTIGGQRHQD